MTLLALLVESLITAHTKDSFRRTRSWGAALMFPDLGCLPQFLVAVRTFYCIISSSDKSNILSMPSPSRILQASSSSCVLNSLTLYFSLCHFHRLQRLYLFLPPGVESHLTLTHAFIISLRGAPGNWKRL